MFKFLMIAASLLFSSAGIAQAKNDVCSWHAPTGYSFFTTGYSWGGSPFSTVEECTAALRSTLLFLDFGQGRADGLIRFKDTNGVTTTCRIIAIQFPYSQPPTEFQQEMALAYHGKSSAKKIMRFQSYLDENTAIQCH